MRAPLAHAPVRYLSGFLHVVGGIDLRAGRIDRRDVTEQLDTGDGQLLVLEIVLENPILSTVFQMSCSGEAINPRRR